MQSTTQCMKWRLNPANLELSGWSLSGTWRVQTRGQTNVPGRERSISVPEGEPARNYRFDMTVVNKAFGLAIRLPLVLFPGQQIGTNNRVHPISNLTKAVETPWLKLIWILITPATKQRRVLNNFFRTSVLRGKTRGRKGRFARPPAAVAEFVDLHHRAWNASVCRDRKCHRVLWKHHLRPIWTSPGQPIKRVMS